MVELFERVQQLRLPELKLYQRAQELSKTMRRRGVAPWALVHPPLTKKERGARRAEVVRQGRLWARISKIIPFLPPQD